VTELPWFPLWVNDWLGSRKVRTMPLHALGMYSLLLAHQWKDGPLPLDLDEMAMLIGRPVEDVAAAWHYLEPLFVETGSGWANMRLERERANQIEKHQRRVEAGRKGAAQRWTSGG
jgi:uncharacterized protein YdaU (DUF1376 family)